MTRSAGATLGFTLVEVLVALIIVSLGAGAVMSALSTGARTISRVEERSFAEWVALNVLAETRLASEAPSLGESAGEVQLANLRWRWQQVVSRTNVPGVLQIEVRVQRATVDRADVSPRPVRELAKVVGARLDQSADFRPRDIVWDSARRQSNP